MLWDNLLVPSFFGFLTPYNLLVMDNYIICHCIILVDSVMNLVKTCIQVCRITPMVSHCIYVGNKEIYCFFKVSSIISVLFSTDCCLFHNSIIFFSNNTFFITYEVIFENPPQVK